MDIDKGLEKACRICGNVDKAHEGHVTKSGAIIFRFKCSRCGHSHERKVKTPKFNVEPLIGFNRKPMRWEPKT